MDRSKVHKDFIGDGLKLCVAVLGAAVAALCVFYGATSATPTQQTPTPTPYPTAIPYDGPGAYELLAGQSGGLRLPNYGIYANSTEAIGMSGQLPLPLPSLPSRIRLEDLVFPRVDFSSLPSVVTGRETVMSQFSARLSDVRDMLNTEYDNARALITDMRSLSTSMLEFVGAPEDAITARAGTRALTVTQMAQEMSQSISVALSYARALSALGPLGLDVVFIFVGLAWIFLMNVVEWLALAIVWFWKRVIQVFAGIVNLIRLILELIRTIRAIILI